MRHLLARTAIAPVLVALTVAETTIGTATTAAVKTSAKANV